MDQRHERSEMQQAKERWEEERLRPALDRVERAAMPSDLSQQRLYTPLDDAGRDYPGDLGFPGDYPYTRGIYPSMYQGRLWTMRQYAGFGSPEETHERFAYLLGQGQGGLLVAFDLPTQLGFDSDDPRAKGEVGVVGVAVDSLADMETIFGGLPLEQASPSLTMNSAATVALAMYVAVAEQEGVPAARINGTTQNDILKEFIARGTYIFPPRPSMRLTVDLIEYCTAHLPRWNVMNICGYHVREAGSTLVQEVAFALANAITYIEACLERGLEIDAFAPRLAFNFNATCNLFQEAAKYRAARRLWARLLRERFGAQEPASWMWRAGAGSAGSTLTAQQPENNIVRVALQALAGILGGVQSFHTAAYDEALALPSEHSALLALRTQQVLAHESGAAEVIDPLGGSYYVESLTDQIETEVNRYIARIEAEGGMLKAIDEGRAQTEIAQSAYAYQQQIETQERTVVGVNRFEDDDDPAIELHRPRPEVVEAQIAKLQSLRRERDNAAVRGALAALEGEARGDGNLMYPILEAVRAYATIGEICAVLRDVFGEYRAASF
ncbi:MAG: methylmalonyl-CoA mutase family protein [Alphaproteobacteria bacterium]|jgi:methylmalonyl-CoA mutase N-terminal domain/subunit|nr:methylmalonyl-CoA mutase family protein [Alphaproteobacteria bacterium]MDP6812754.1 methylmalonyl-CoA mutase family protein [Alphaproteobacteria bacterium]